MRKTLFAALSICLAASANAADAEFEAGKKLFNGNCLSCHNPNLDPPQAPPMFAVQKQYKMVTVDRASFLDRLTTFVMQPTAEKAVLKKAVEYLGVMPRVNLSEAHIRQVAAYIHDASFEVPCSHWQAGMKMARAKGDMEHFNKDQQQFNAMCAKAEPAPAGKAEAGSLKQIMQQLGRDYASLNRAILLEDFEGAAQSAHAIAFHDKPSMGQRLRIISALATEMANFKQADERVHQLAVEIENAAGDKDAERLIRHQSNMLAACMSCHRSYRNRVIALFK